MASKGKKGLCSSAENESPRRRDESLRRTTQFKSSGIALHGLGHDKPVALDGG